MNAQQRGPLARNVIEAARLDRNLDAYFTCLMESHGYTGTLEVRNELDKIAVFAARASEYISLRVLGDDQERAQEGADRARDEVARVLCLDLEELTRL